MQKCYRYDDESKRLYITGCGTKIAERNAAVVQFCDDYSIKLSEFNVPIVIEPQVTECIELLKDCKSCSWDVPGMYEI